MEYKIPVKEEDLSLAVIKTLNCFLNLTEKEMELLAYLVNKNIKTIDYDTRRQIAVDFDKDYFYTTNLIKRLYDKEILVRTKYGKSIHPNLINSLTSKKITISFETQKDNTSRIRSN